MITNDLDFRLPYGLISGYRNRICIWCFTGWFNLGVPGARVASWSKPNRNCPGRDMRRFWRSWMVMVQTAMDFFVELMVSPKKNEVGEIWSKLHKLVMMNSSFNMAKPRLQEYGWIWSPSSIFMAIYSHDPVTTMEPGVLFQSQVPWLSMFSTQNQHGKANFNH